MWIASLSEGGGRHWFFPVISDNDEFWRWLWRKEKDEEGGFILSKKHKFSHIIIHHGFAPFNLDPLREWQLERGERRGVHVTRSGSSYSSSGAWQSGERLPSPLNYFLLNSLLITRNKFLSSGERRKSFYFQHYTFLFNFSHCHRVCVCVCSSWRHFLLMAQVHFLSRWMT